MMSTDAYIEGLMLWSLRTSLKCYALSKNQFVKLFSKTIKMLTLFLKTTFNKIDKTTAKRSPGIVIIFIIMIHYL